MYMLCNFESEHLYLSGKVLPQAGEGLGEGVAMREGKRQVRISQDIATAER